MKAPFTRFILIGSMALAFTIAQQVNSGTPLPPPPVFVPPPPPVFVPPIVNVIDPEVSDAATANIVRQLSAATNFCRRLPASEYTVDCLGDALAQIAKSIPATGDYAEARAAIDQASRKLRSLALANASPDLPKGRVRSTGTDGAKSASPLTPVRTETMQDTNAAAIAILEEAQTILLRSAENSAVRKVHYERIAQAIGSNKILLRST